MLDMPMSEVYDICQRCVWDMPEICLIFVLDMPEICLRCTWDESEIYLRHVWDMPDIYLRYALDISESMPEIYLRRPEICLGNFLDLQEIYQRYAWNLHDICLTFVWDIPQIGLGYSCEIPDKCLRFTCYLSIVNKMHENKKKSMSEWVRDWKSDLGELLKNAALGMELNMTTRLFDILSTEFDKLQKDFSQNNYVKYGIKWIVGEYN